MHLVVQGSMGCLQPHLNSPITYTPDNPTEITKMTGSHKKHISINCVPGGSSGGEGGLVGFLCQPGYCPIMIYPQIIHQYFIHNQCFMLDIQYMSKRGTRRTVVGEWCINIRKYALSLKLSFIVKNIFFTFKNIYPFLTYQPTGTKQSTTYM